jgi:hypothetical protein
VTFQSSMDIPATSISSAIYLANFLRGFENANEPRRRIARALLPNGGIAPESHALLETLANADMATIVDAGTLFRRFGAHTEKFASAKTTRQNPGAPGKLEFVRMMAKAWTCLTGTFPSQSEEFNRCDTFIRLAWADATGKPFDEERQVPTRPKGKKPADVKTRTKGKKREGNMSSPFLHQIRRVTKEMLAEKIQAIDYPLPFMFPDDP